MFLGAVLVWAAERFMKNEQSLLHRVFVKNSEAACAGIVAGGGLMGVIVTLVETFVLGG